jgi:hypothetical protein
MAQKTCWYFGKELKLTSQPYNADEAQAMINAEHKKGKLACCLHKGNKIYFYSEPATQ